MPTPPDLRDYAVVYTVHALILLLILAAVDGFAYVEYQFIVAWATKGLQKTAQDQVGGVLINIGLLLILGVWIVPSLGRQYDAASARVTAEEARRAQQKASRDDGKPKTF